MWLLYLVFSGLTDLLAGLGMQGGIWLFESFAAPALARSPRDFWAKRWNLFIHRFALRNIFVPLGGRRRPLRAMALVFVASGVVHEFVVFATGGVVSPYVGAMLLFFGLQGLAVGLQVIAERKRWVPRMPRLLAVGLHQVWMTCTAPLFFAPLEYILRTQGAAWLGG